MHGYNFTANLPKSINYKNIEEYRIYMKYNIQLEYAFPPLQDDVKDSLRMAD